jgi:DMSO/TMAO reductase YedYZ molybdopterin-dependent catalytic subunit
MSGSSKLISGLGVLCRESLFNGLDVSIKTYRFPKSPFTKRRTQNSALTEKEKGKMKKITLILSVTIAIAVFLGATVTVYYSMQVTNPNKPGPLPSGEPPQWQIKVTGDVEQEKTWTLKEIAQLPLTNVTAIVNGENATYVGVPLYDFSNKTSISWDAGPIDIISGDGNKATMNIFQAYNSSAYPYYYNNNVIMLAFVKNGQWMTNETGGPVKLVAPYFAAEYQVENVAEIHFDPWIIAISGEVTNPLVITRENLASFQSRTVYAEFAPSEKRWSNWTGLPILNVLEAANTSNRAEKITIIAVDGYEKTYTIQQVKDGQMLIGYAENEHPLPHNQGGPFRLFAPTDQYKWAQFWVKFIKEIIVS